VTDNTCTTISRTAACHSPRSSAAPTLQQQQQQQQALKKCNRQHLNHDQPHSSLPLATQQRSTNPAAAAAAANFQ
jgi:hypothetical protein